MKKLLYKTQIQKSANNLLVLEYYLTANKIEFENRDYMYYGVMITSSLREDKRSTLIQNIFPYRHDAVAVARNMYEHKVTPLSARQIIEEIIDTHIIEK